MASTKHEVNLVEVIVHSVLACGYGWYFAAITVRKRCGKFYATATTVSNGDLLAATGWSSARCATVDLHSYHAVRVPCNESVLQRLASHVLPGIQVGDCLPSER